MERTVGQTPGVTTRSWLALALGILGLAGVLALLVGLARSDWLGPRLPASYFRVALVAHVDLLLVAWYLVMPVLIWRRVGLLGGRGERAAYGLIAVGVAGMVVPGLVGAGRPVLANYVPFLVHPVFLAGLAVFFLGVGLAAALALPGLRPGQPAPQRAAAAGAACVLGALASMVVVAGKLLWLGQLGSGRLGGVFWVGGHLLQFGHTAFMATGFGLLLDGLARRRGDVERLLALVGLYPLGVAAGLALALLEAPQALADGRALVTLKSWGLGVPAALSLPLAARLWWESRAAAGEERQARRSAVGAGLLVLAAGGAVAVLGDLGRQTTLIPGHYHAVLTAVALSFMGLTYLVLAEEGVRLPRPRWAVLQPYLYGLGTVALVGGMVWAGVHGAPRKTPGAGWATDPGTLLALNLWGIGTLLAVAGGAGFLVNVAWAVLRWEGRPAGARVARAPGDG